MAQVRGRYTLGGIQFKEGEDVMLEVAQQSNGGAKGLLVEYLVSGAIPVYTHTAVLTKAGVGAMTIVAPTAGTHDGVIITVVSATAQAHTVTATTIGFNAGDAASDVGTFGGAIGDGFSFIAHNGEWLVLTNTNVTLA